MKVQERKKAAKAFAKRWSNRGDEKQDSQSFWIDLLQTVYGIENPVEYITFESRVSNMMDSTSYIDGYIEKTNVLIEQKSRMKDLNKGIKQSDGSFLTPFQQAQRYSATLSYSRRPRWIITCNFKEFYIYDMEKPNSEPSIVKLEDLEKDYYRLEILVDKTNTQIEKETKVSIKAGKLIGEIYDSLIKQYNNPEATSTLKSINQLSVRLVFCFYAEDAGLFGKKGIFHDYLKDFTADYFRNALIELFKVLNTPVENRDPYLSDKLMNFPYVNGGLFSDMSIEIPQFTEHLRELILNNATSEFDWSEISPTIFGSVFESTLNPEQRHQGGMHYTSIENIHKVIDPLFLDELKEELNEIKQYKQFATIKRRALEFQNKLASLTFLDPASGSGNFLTETYLSLRKLENEALVLMYGDNVLLDTEENLIKVSLNQFYGIEINDFAVSVAKTALWIAESQMFERTKDLIFIQIDYLPIKSYTTIVNENALRIDWSSVVDKNKLNYIIGNPPFFGSSNLLPSQTDEIKKIFKGYKKVGKLDYVAGWYGKTAKFIKDTKIRSAFVSTNSITQGQQVAILWKPLIEDYNVKIDFAHRTFVWNSEALGKASVHCVIIGFSNSSTVVKEKKIFDEGTYKIVDHINPYLVEGPSLLIDGRKNPISDVTKMTVGSRPNDNSHLMITETEYNELIEKEPRAKKFLKRAISGGDFINERVRYCLWLKNASPHEIRSIPQIRNKVEATRQYRLNSSTLSTRELAKTPYLFQSDRQPITDFLFVPQLSSHNRKYIPVGFLTPNFVPLDPHFVVSDASLYDFGVMTSNVHMGWVRAVAGRFKSDYRYSNSIVYNTFPWPEVSSIEKERIESTAKAILDARELYPDSTLADLYDELTMPVELRKAHQENDKAVMRAYNLKVGSTSEADAVARLFELYEDKLEKYN